MQQEPSPIIPKHVGFIVDGNRRWAREQGLPTLEGHRRGYELLKELTVEAIDQGVAYVSGYIFSTENWSRSKEEVSYLMDLALRYAQRDLDSVIDKGIRIRVLGTTEGLSDKLVRAWKECEQRSAHCTRGTLALCFNYGGTVEIANACRQLIEQGTRAEGVTPDAIRKHLYQPDIPDVDIMVRTSGEQRISNFMLWRMGYSELLFLDKYWPAMTKDDITAIIKEYSRRNRRFGGN